MHFRVKPSAENLTLHDGWLLSNIHFFCLQVLFIYVTDFYESVILAPESITLCWKLVVIYLHICLAALIVVFIQFFFSTTDQALPNIVTVNII